MRLQLEAFVKNSIMPISIYDRDMRMLAASQAWLGMYQLTEADFGRLHYETFPDIPAHWRLAHQAAMKGLYKEHVEEPYTLANGAKGWHRWQCSPWHDSHSDIGGIIIISEDITERKSKEAELAYLLARFELIQQAAHIGAWDWNITEGNITLNAEYYDIIGWSKDKCRFRRWRPPIPG